MEKIRLGISACLLGENVRYDGGNTHDRFLTDTLGKYVEYVPICPEVECGLPVPREAMRLEGDLVSPRLIRTHTREDMTDRFMKWSETRAAELDEEDLCGFIFKSRSPSCGIERVKVYDERGVPAKKGTGMFAKAFIKRFPLIPVENEDRIYDPELWENFIERIFTLRRWRDAAAKGKTRGDLVAFHTIHKLQVLSHSTKHYRLMGSLVAKANELPIKELYRQYQILLMEVVQLKATPKKNTNVLMHMMGYFKKELTSGEKQELLEVIDNYRMGYIPLIMPVTLINHYARKYDRPYLKGQIYLNPHPMELQLRNHV